MPITTTSRGRSQVQSIVIGVDARYRNALAVRGFYWAESVAAAQRNEFSFAGGTALQQTQAAPAELRAGHGRAVPVPQPRLSSRRFRSRSSRAGPSRPRTSGASSTSTTTASTPSLGLRNGTAIVEVTDPANPREVVTIPGNASPWREVKVYQVFDAGREPLARLRLRDDGGREQRLADDRHVGPAADGRARVDEHGHELAAHAVRLEHRLLDERGAAGRDARCCTSPAAI